MRHSAAFLCITIVLIIGYLVTSCSTLISLLFEDCTASAIPAADFESPNSPLLDNTSQVIPKIIHQTYINTSIPVQWQAGQKACIDLHPDYEYILWTDESSRAFVEKEYPWFLSTFDSYSHPIQRADSIRYFILYHYGGIYLDLDDGCARRLDPLLAHPAWVRKTIPTGISNDAMGSVPGHPFFRRVIESLKGYDNNWIMPYITVMGSTGPLFLSLVWKQYSLSSRPLDEIVWVLMTDDYKGNEWSFFHISRGSSWHEGDAKAIFWMGQHWMLLTVFGFTLGGLLIRGVWRLSIDAGHRNWDEKECGDSQGRWRTWIRHDARDEYEALARMA